MPLCWIWVLDLYRPNCEMSSDIGGPVWEMGTARGQLKWPRRSPETEGMLNDQLRHQDLHSTPPSTPCPMTAGHLLLCLQQTSLLGPAMVSPPSTAHHPFCSASGTFGSALWPRAGLQQCDHQLEFHLDFPGFRLQPFLFSEGSGSGLGAFVICVLVANAGSGLSANPVFSSLHFYSLG